MSKIQSSSLAIQLPTALVMDIETSHRDWDDIPEDIQKYLLNRKDKGKDQSEEEVKKSLGLKLGLQEVVAVSFLREDGHSITLAQGPVSNVKMENHTDIRGPEETIINGAWDILEKQNKKGDVLVTFNGKIFDIPVLMVRSAQLGIVTPHYFFGPKWDLMNYTHIDLKDIFNHMGKCDTYSVEFMCYLFGIPSPKKDISGADVAAAFKRGEIERIASYCLNDVRAEMALYHVAKDYFLPCMSRYTSSKGH